MLINATLSVGSHDHPTSCSSKSGSISLTLSFRCLFDSDLSSFFLSGRGKNRGASAFDFPGVRGVLRGVALILRAGVRADGGAGGSFWSSVDSFVLRAILSFYQILLHRA